MAAKPKARILLVDKDAEFLETHKDLLEGRGYQVFTAESGRDGLETVRSEMPDLVVMDVVLEEHDTGFVVSGQLKNDPLFGRIPILIVSSVGPDSDVRFSQEEDGYWMKADDYVEKPVEPDAFLQRVADLLSRNDKE